MSLCAGVFVLMCKDVTGVNEQADEWKIQKTGMCFGCCRKAENVLYTVAISRTNRYNNKSTDNNNNGINRETDVGDVSFLIEDRDRVKSVVAVGFLQETSKLWSSR